MKQHACGPAPYKPHSCAARAIWGVHLCAARHPHTNNMFVEPPVKFCARITKSAECQKKNVHRGTPKMYQVIGKYFGAPRTNIYETKANNKKRGESTYMRVLSFAVSCAVRATRGAHAYAPNGPSMLHCCALRMHRMRTDGRGPQLELESGCFVKRWARGTIS